MATTDFVVKNGLVVTENAVINEITDASSKDTGALVVEGGVGIEKKLYVGTDLNVGSNTTLAGDLAVNGGDLTTTAATFNLLNSNATSLNIGGAATTVEIGADTGTTNVNNNLDVDGDVNIDGGDLTVSTGTFNLANTTATTVNAFGAATDIQIGAATGTTNVNNNLDVDGDVNIDGGDLTVSTSTFNLANVTATTVNFAGAATDVQIGAATGTTNVNNNLVVDLDLQVKGGDLTTDQTTFNLVNATATTVNFAGAATNIQIGAATGTTNVNNNLDVDGDVNIDGGDLTVSTATFNLANTTATTVNFAGAATSLNLGATAGTGTTTVKNSFKVDGSTELGSSGVNSVTVNAGTVNVPNSIALVKDDSTANGVSYPISVRHTTSGTPLNGIGTGIEFVTETAANNNEVGALIESVATDVTATSEDFDLVFKLMTGGAAPTEKFRIGSNGNVTVNAGLILGTGDFSTTQSTFNLVNTTATTVNFAGDATAINIGATSGTTNVKNNLNVTGDLDIDGGDLTVSTSTFNLANTTATTLNVGGAATTLNLGAATGTTTVKNNLDVDGDVNIDGGDLTVSTTTFNLANATATTVNFAGAATDVQIGSSTGTTEINNNLNVVGDVDIDGGDLTASTATFNLINATATTVNFAGASTALTIGATTGTATIRNASVVMSGDLEVRGGDLTTNQTTFNLVNATATTLNVGGAATTVNIGAAGSAGVLTVKNDNVALDGDLEVKGGDLTTNKTTFNLVNATATTVNFAGAATDVQIGAATGTTNINNNLDVDGDVNIDGGDLTTSATTFNLLNATATTVNFAGAATAIEIGASTGTTNVNNDLDVDGDVNIDGGDLTTSATTFNLLNATATTINFGSAATAVEIGATTGTTSVNNSLTVDGNTTLGNASGDLITLNANTVNVPNTITITEDDATANAVSYPVTFRHTTTGTPANGIGIGIQFAAETTANNNEIGATIEAVVTDVTATSEDFDLIFKTMAAGAAAAERVKINNSTVAINTGLLDLTNTTSNRIQWTTNGIAAPAFTTRSAGTKLVLYPNIGAAAADYALGIESNVLWFGVPTAASQSFKWYGGTTLALQLTGAGNLSVTGDVEIKGGDLTTDQTTFNLLNGTATTINFGGAADTLNIGKSGGTTVIAGDLTVNGTTTTINATTVSVDDKNIELGSVATPTDLTADGGGITLKGATDKTFNWIDATDSWTSSEHMDLASGKVYKINQTEVLNATTLGSGVVSSSLTTVGTIGTGTWQGTIVSPTYGGTGINNGSKTITLGGNFTHSGAHTLTLTTTANTSVTLPTSGTLATTGNLSQFASTTSAQLAGVISDETGTGVLVFGTSPSFTTSVTTGSASFDVFNATATTVNAFGAATTLNVGNAAAAQTVTVGGSSTGASTYNFGTGTTAAATIKTLNIGTGGAASSTTNVNIGSSNGGTVTVNSGTLVGALTTQTVFNTVATTLNIGGAATAFNAGATTGTMTLRSPTIVGSQTTQNLFNTVATTVNFAGAATTVEIGAATGTTNINNNLEVDGDVTIDGGDLIVSTATFNLANATATTVNFAGAATTVEIGASTGTTNINNDLDVDGDVNIDGGDLTVSTGTFNLANTTATTVNFAGAGTTISIGAATGTTTINNANTVVTGDLAVNGADITTTATGASSIFNANTTTLNLAQAATTISMGATTGTTTVRNSLAVNGNATLGDASGDTITINASTASVPNTLTFTVDDAVTNNISYPVKIQHTTTGTPANGIGTGIQFITETTANNFEIGASIEAVVTDVTAASEDFDLVFDTMLNGAAATEKVRIKSDGRVGIGTNSPNRLLHVKTTSGFGVGTFESALSLNPASADAGEILAFLGNSAVSGLTFSGSDARLLTFGVATDNAAYVRAPVLRLAATNSVGLAPGGSSNALTAISNGNIGIGTTSPGARLDIVTATPASDTALRIKSNTQFVSPDGTDIITMRMTDTDTLSFTGDSGQLFSITDSLTGTIFAVNDISGVPSIEVFDDGRVILAELFGKVGIGTASPSAKLHVNLASTPGTTSTYDTGLYSRVNLAPTASGSSGTYGTLTDVYRQSASDNFNHSSVYVSFNGYAQEGTGSSASLGSLYSNYNSNNISSGSASEVYNQYNFTGIGQFGTASVTSAYGSYTGITVGATGQLTNYYGAYLATPSGTITNKFSIYSADTASPMYHAGNVGVGTLAPGSKLHVRQDQNGTTRTIIQNRNSTGTPISELAFITGSFDIADSRYAYINSGGGGSNYLSFGTSNGAAPTEAMRINAVNTVGIAATLPAAAITSKLYVSSDISIAGANRSILGNLYYDSNWKYAGNGYGWGFREDNAGKLQMIRAANNAGGVGAAAAVSLTDLFTFDLVNNRVGLATGTPQTLLHVYNSVTGNQNAPGIMLDRVGTTTEVGITWATAATRKYSLMLDNDSTDNLHLYKWDGTGSGFVQTWKDGLVGISSTSPAGNLDIGVNGNRSSGNIMLGSKTAASAKWGSVAVTQYDSAVETEGYTLVSGAATSTANNITIGGGLAEMNAATGIFFYTAANTTTRTGTSKLAIIANGNVGVGTDSPGYKLEVNGSFAATTKSFVIDHPTKPGMKLRYGSLEGPENGVYVRGRTTGKVIQLPDYWTGLVDPDTITVNLTAIGGKQDLWVEDIKDNCVYIGGDSVNCFYTVYGERKDVDRLTVEFEQE